MVLGDVPPKEPEQTHVVREAGQIAQPPQPQQPPLQGETRASEQPEAAVSSFTETFLYQHIGPLPHPALLKAYADLGLADRIVKMAEKEQDKRIASDRWTEKYLSQGQVIGALLGLAALGLAAFATYRDQPWVAGTAIASVAAIVGAFVWRWRADPTRPK